MLYLGNIIDTARVVRSEVNLERLKIRDMKSASAVKRHISTTEIVERKRKMKD
jgi:hypothetical protein